MELVAGRVGCSFYVLLLHISSGGWYMLLLPFLMASGEIKTGTMSIPVSLPSHPLLLKGFVTNPVRVKLDIAGPCVSDTDWVWKNVLCPNGC